MKEREEDEQQQQQSSQITIGKGTWLDKVADTLIKREKKLGRKLDLIRVESGLGASGIPHIGSMGDAARAYGIALALQNMGYKAELIAYSDDMDGLRKIPAGLPESLRDYITRPVSEIPDPFHDSNSRNHNNNEHSASSSCHSSYGAHMSSLLLDGLDKAGIKYRFQSGRDAYKSGKLVNQIDTILQNSERLGKKIADFVGQDKYVSVLPYFPVCSNCGRLYTAAAQEYLQDEKKVTYICKGSRIGKNEIPGCGHKGVADITKGEGKLAWKVEFAARWQAFDIRFEAFGKDIMDSVRVNDWVCDEILGYSHPLHVKYEMFLDKSGKKISKSSGNVLTPQMWLKYGSAESILLLLFKRIAGTHHVGIEDVPALMDEYDYYEDLYFAKIKEDNPAKLTKIKGIYEYINKLDPPRQPPSPHIPYRFLVQQAAIYPDDPDRLGKVFARLVKYGMAKEMNDALARRITLASNWAEDDKAKEGHTAQEERFNVTLDKDNQRKAVIDLLDVLKEFSGAEETQENAKTLQSRVFDVARSNSMEPKELFTLLYRMFLNADRGPRIGNYFLDLGYERTSAVLKRYL